MGLRKDNRGVSLIELVVVLAIMTIFTGVIMYSISTITGAKVNMIVDELESSMERTKSLSLGKEQAKVELILYHDTTAGTYKVKIMNDVTVEVDKELGPDTISLGLRFVGEPLTVSLDDVTPASVGGIHSCTQAGLHVMYDRSTGAFVANLNQTGGADRTYCESIRVSNGFKTRTLELVGKTGKIVVH